MDDLREYLLDCGASLVGFASTEGLAPEFRGDFGHGISMTLALAPDGVARLRARKERPIRADDAIHAALRVLANLAADYLAERGYRVAIRPVGESDDMQHRLLAARAGISWIGKSGLSVTWEYGSAVRLITVLTDAPLPGSTVEAAPNCGACLECTEACPSHAPSGRVWRSEMRPEELVNRELCRARRGMLAAQGKACFHCMSVCPFTAAYLSTYGFTTEEQLRAREAAGYR